MWEIPKRFPYKKHGDIITAVVINVNGHCTRKDIIPEV